MSAGSSHICFGNFAHNCDTCYNLKSPAFSIETLLQGYFGKLISNFFVLHFIFYPKHHFSHLQDKKYYCTLKIKSVCSFTLHCLHFLENAVLACVIIPQLHLNFIESGWYFRACGKMMGLCLVLPSMKFSCLLYCDLYHI